MTDEKPKTLGQIAYSAYLGFAGTPEDLQFSSDAHREAWQAAAEAAVRHWKMHDEPPPSIYVCTPKERAVIEAAREWYAQNAGADLLPSEHSLARAIEALEELER
jgi:hypothetical protein